MRSFESTRPTCFLSPHEKESTFHRSTRRIKSAAKSASLSPGQRRREKHRTTRRAYERRFIPNTDPRTRLEKPCSRSGSMRIFSFLRFFQGLSTDVDNWVSL